MHVNRGLLGWGVFFIAFGAVPIAVRSGAIDAAVARRAWELWPLIVIGIGLGLVLQRTRAAAVGGVLVALVFGLMAGGLIAAGVGPAGGFALCGPGPGSAGATVPAEAKERTGTFGAAASVNLAVDCGSMAVDTAAGSGWGVGWDHGGQEPIVTASDASLTVSDGGRRGVGIGRPTAGWVVTLPRDPDLRLDLVVNAGSTKASLDGLHLSSVEVSVNAGDGKVDLSRALGTTSVSASVNAGSLGLSLPAPSGTLTGSMTVNVGALRVCVPPGVPLRIRAGEHALGSNNFGDRGLTSAGGSWTRGGFDGATARIDLTISANLGSVTLDPENGCG